MQIQTWLIVSRSNRHPYYNIRVSKTAPNVGWDEVSLRVNLSIPDGLFKKPMLEAKITVPEEAVKSPIIEAETINNIQEAIKTQTGMEVKITL